MKNLSFEREYGIPNDAEGSNYFFPQNAQLESHMRRTVQIPCRFRD